METPADAPVAATFTSSVIKGGAVSGALPEAEAFAVHFPGYPSSVDRAIETLGGLQEIANVRSSESSNLELRFRPEDPYCHPAFGEPRPSAGLLLRIRKTKGDPNDSGGVRGDAVEDGGGQKASPPQAETLSAEIVARVNSAYHFEGMVDYQYVLPVHAANARRKKRTWASDDEPQLEQDATIDMDQADVMMLMPPLFSIKNRPENTVLMPSRNVLSKDLQKGVVEQTWEMQIEPCLALPFDIEKIPQKVNWEDKISKETADWECQIATSKLFEERPIWPRRSLYEQLLNDGHEISENQYRRLLFRAGYYFATGPYGKFWIRKGYDPRQDPESRIFQKVDLRMSQEMRKLGTIKPNSKSNETWKQICSFEVWPSKNFVCLQLFELDDDFIQQEIRKPTDQTICTHSTGWFSMGLLKLLRLRVTIRFLSIHPDKAAEKLLKSTHQLFEKSKREEASGKYKKSEIVNNITKKDSDPSDSILCTGSEEPEHNDQDGLGNYDSEDDEEEMELDEYESSHVAYENNFFSAADTIGESVHNDYLQELLRSFPQAKGASEQQGGDGAFSKELSDGEYQIYEQDSEDEDDYS